MNSKFQRAFFLIAVFPGMLMVAACGPAVSPTGTPTAIPGTATPCPPANWPCPADSLTLTAVMAETFAAVPSNTPPPWATVIPVAGDLGWGAVHGRITDGVTHLPIEGAKVTCEHVSYTSPYLCNAVTTTTENGIYAFAPVFFHDTDRITLLVEAPGYASLRFEQSFFTHADFQADLGLFPATDQTPGPTLTPMRYASETPPPTSTPPPPLTPTKTATPILMCTPPPCPWNTFACGNPNGCPGGCGTICLTPTPTR